MKGVPPCAEDGKGIAVVAKADFLDIAVCEGARGDSEVDPPRQQRFEQFAVDGFEQLE